MAEPGLAGVCPGCRVPLVPKCGSLKAWHWAHRVGNDCDPWSEPIGPWHVLRQAPLRPECVEVPIQVHRADIVGAEGMVIELQHSSISPEGYSSNEKHSMTTWSGFSTPLFASARSVLERSRSLPLAVPNTSPPAASRSSSISEISGGCRAVHRTAFRDCSGVGHIHNRDWFASTYLTGLLCERPSAVPQFRAPDEEEAEPMGESPLSLLLDEAPHSLDRAVNRGAAANTGRHEVYAPELGLEG